MRGRKCFQVNVVLVSKYARVFAFVLKAIAWLLAKLECRPFRAMEVSTASDQTVHFRDDYDCF